MAALIQKLFKPKWQHAKAEVRLQALESLDDQAVLLSLAQNDDDLNVRLKALQRLNRHQALIPFFNDSTQSVRVHAIARFLELALGSNQADTQLSAVSSISDSETLMQIATYAEDENLRQAALQQIQSEQALFDFISSSPSAKARHIAAERIESEALLHNLVKQFKGKDKTLVKIARQKLDVLDAKTAAEAERQASIQKVIDQTKMLAESAFHPTYGAQVVHLKQQWASLDTPSAEQTALFEQSFQQCEQTLSVNQAEAERLAKQQEDQKLAQEEQQATIRELNAAISQIKQFAKVEAASLNGLLKTQQQRWHEAEQVLKADKGSKAEYENSLKKLIQIEATAQYLENKTTELEDIKQKCSSISNCSHSQLTSLKKALEKMAKAASWPDDMPKPNSIQDILNWNEQVEAALHNNKQNEKEKLSKIEQGLKKLETSIAEGHIKEARKAQQQVQQSLSSIPPSKAKAYQGSLHLLSGQLKELMDWKGFATTPKMESLCAKMEALIETELTPDRIADEIHQLQEEWKSLGSGDPKTTQMLWQRFKEASDKAYEPCRAYFNELGELRQSNKAKREELCQQLETFYQQHDWSKADWKAIQQLMDKARDEWRDYSPVDRKDHKPLQNRFNDVLNQIRNKLTEEYESNAEDKQSLVDKAAALLEAEDLNEAIEVSKKLQAQWKTLGQAGRKDFQLWKTFRAHCDALFARREDEKAQRKSEIEQTIQSAEALLQKAKSLLDSDSPESQRNELADIQSQYREIQVPKRVHEKISRELDKIGDQLEQEVKNKKLAAEKQQWINAKQISSLLANLETNSGQEAADIQQQIETLPLPSTAQSVLKARLTSADTQTPADSAQLQRLCLELEITMGLDSPEQDKEARMALQVTLLQERMGQSAPPRHEQLQQLLLAWFALRAGDAGYEAMSDRFFAAVDRCF